MLPSKIPRNHFFPAKWILQKIFSNSINITSSIISRIEDSNN
jgi:hypothetical protein